MFSLLSNLAGSVLISAATLTNPTNPKALSFDASAYVTVNKQIRVAVQKNTKVPVVVLLRNKDNEILFRQNISKKESTYAVKLDVNELTDGQYELEVSSSEGSIRKQFNLSTAPALQVTRIVALQ
ncbi:hypothetical protein [Spirosoma pollinicola]|uniref:Secretion system C-terminal sorting domain-containing protein n=1 Tax=Spirosoma pollinicola TaxID=2057025 RepID=A0A2K8Z2C7_9BACT|nr:hypothetical protein [Spirosoma pollinicola]AUD03984.1 hypothetical protein CWM47_20440 [Spirosoma pollinicola]